MLNTNLPQIVYDLAPLMGQGRVSEQSCKNLFSRKISETIQILQILIVNGIITDLACLFSSGILSGMRISERVFQKPHDLAPHNPIFHVYFKSIEYTITCEIYVCVI